MKDKVPKILSRLDLVKNISEHSKLLNDCFDVIMDLHHEVVRLETHNARLLQVIYQNQSELESTNESTGE
jgi:hypothetical protein